MQYEYLFLKEAQAQYEEALVWYLERSLAAAQNFVEAIDISIEKICLHPYRWRNEFENFYELGLKKYPFSIIYSIDAKNKKILITSVYHHKRNPEKKYKK